MGKMEIVIQEFLRESFEGLDLLAPDLRALREGSAGSESFNRIYRVVHTIKGTGSFLGFHRLEALTRTGEVVLGRLRDGELQPSPELSAHLLAMVDAVRVMLSTIASSRSEGDNRFRALLNVLSEYRE